MIETNIGGNTTPAFLHKLPNYVIYIATHRSFRNCRILIKVRIEIFRKGAFTIASAVRLRRFGRNEHVNFSTFARVEFMLMS